MVITRTPFRMSFFGGRTDFPGYFKEYGGSVLSTSFDKYCYVTVKHLPQFFDYKNQVTYSKIERCKSVDSIEHPAVRNAMKYLNMDEIIMSYDADLPGRSGLGTSSSFAVGMLEAFHALKGEYVDKRKLAEEAIYLERNLCGESGGWQDQIAASFGGLNRIDFTDDSFTVNPVVIDRQRRNLLNDSLMLFFTGFTRFSSDVSKKQTRAIKEKLSELSEMRQLVFQAEKILTDKNSDLNEFGRLLDYTWKLKRGITSEISTDSIDSFYKKGLDAGALGGKLLGAGGGGYLLFFVERDKQQSVKEALSELTYVPFHFESDGTKVLYYKSEDFFKEAKNV